MQLFFKLGMKKRFHIKNNYEFQEIINKGKRVVTKNYILYYDQAKMVRNDRVGISASKKLGNAVERNKIRRQVRMMVDEISDFNRGVDIIIIVRNNYLSCSYEDNKKQLFKAYEKVYNNTVDEL